MYKDVCKGIVEAFDNFPIDESVKKPRVGIQPFACLPNHVVGKGVIKALRKTYPQANIAAVDYDPGASEVNQLNRIKLMLSAAQKSVSQNQKG